MPKGINNNGIGTHEYLPKKMLWNQVLSNFGYYIKIRSFVGVTDAVWVSCVLFFHTKNHKENACLKRKMRDKGAEFLTKFLVFFFIFWTKQKIISVCFGVTWVILVSKNDGITGKHADKNGLRLAAMASISITLSQSYALQNKMNTQKTSKKKSHWNMQTMSISRRSFKFE